MAKVLRDKCTVSAVTAPFLIPTGNVGGFQTRPLLSHAYCLPS